VQSGSGDLRLGSVRADLLARAAPATLTIEDAEAGRLDLTTGSGNVRLGVHAGVAAELDLRSRLRQGTQRAGRQRQRARGRRHPAARPRAAPERRRPVTRALSAAGAAG